MKKIVVAIDGDGQVVVTFEGDYIRRRELDRAVKTIRQRHKQQLRDYRKRMIIEEYEASKGPQESSSKKKVEEQDATDRSSKSGPSSEGRKPNSGPEPVTVKSPGATQGSTGSNAGGDSEVVSGFGSSKDTVATVATVATAAKSAVSSK